MFPEADLPLQDLGDDRNDLALCDRTCHLFIPSEKGLSPPALKLVNRPTPVTLEVPNVIQLRDAMDMVRSRKRHRTTVYYHRS